MFTQRAKPWDSYRKVATQTATPGFLVLMLYDGAIAFLERALAGFDGTDPAQVNQAVNNNILRAQAILCELNGTVNLRRLYLYFHSRLREANFKKQPEPVREILARLRVLRDGWGEMIRRGPPRNREPDGVEAEAVA
jgi:flagellar protein FliS